MPQVTEIIMNNILLLLLKTLCDFRKPWPVHCNFFHFTLPPCNRSHKLSRSIFFSSSSSKRSSGKQFFCISPYLMVAECCYARCGISRTTCRRVVLPMSSASTFRWLTFGPCTHHRCLTQQRSRSQWISSESIFDRAAAMLRSDLYRRATLPSALERCRLNLVEEKEAPIQQSRVDWAF